MKKTRKRISRLRFENITCLALNGLNIITFVMIFAASITKSNQGGLSETMQAIYCTTISLLLILNEVLSPTWIQYYFGFLRLHRGKGMLMLFLGCVVVCQIVFNIIVTIMAFSLGFTHFIISLIPTLPPPKCFLVNWKNHHEFWAEGVDLALSSVRPRPPAIHIHQSAILTTGLSHPGLGSNYLHTNSIPLLQFPHPSAWHPPSSKIGSASIHSFRTSYFNIDCTQYQQGDDSKSNNQYLRVDY